MQRKIEFESEGKKNNDDFAEASFMFSYFYCHLHEPSIFEWINLMIFNFPLKQKNNMFRFFAAFESERKK